MSSSDKYVIFDLDGTLWKENSHTDIINKYFGFPKCDCLPFKIFRRFFPELYMKWLYEKFQIIPDEFIKQYTPTLNHEVVYYLDKFKKNGYCVLILTNAPKRITQMAQEKFQVQAINAPIANKLTVLKKLRISDYSVFTDNITDIDLISSATAATIIIHSHNKKFFKQYFAENASFLELE